MSPFSQMSPRRRAILTFAVPAILFLAMLGLMLALILVSGNAREEDRIVARYVICREVEKAKHALRVDLDTKIMETSEFLIRRPNGIPGIPELNGRVLRAGLERNRALRRSLAPYPRGCAAFARDPSDLNVHVPDPKEKP